MTNYLVDFNYSMPEYETVTISADTYEEAEEAAMEYIRETFADAKNIEIESVKELTV
jgi:hypothetical protein